MPLSDMPLSAQVVLFLTIFVLIGIYPFIKKSMAQLRKLMDARDKPREMFSSLIKDVHQEMFPEHPTSGPLNDFEIIVLRRIAQAGGKAMSRKQINESLLFGDAVLTRTLKSLYDGGISSCGYQNSWSSVSPCQNPAVVMPWSRVTLFS